MHMALPGMPSAFNVLPALQYGNANSASSGNTPLYLDMLHPITPSTRPMPAVIYIHGGGWAEGERSTAMYPWLNPLLAAHGFVTVSITYRLSRWATFPAQIHDAKAAVRWLRANAERYAIDPERIGVWGDSAGGHLAALLGVTGDLDLPELEGNNGSPGYSSRVQAVVARVPPTDFLSSTIENNTPSMVTQLFGGMIGEKEALMRQASPLYYVHRGVPPFQIVHGTNDESVPFEQGERFAQALTEVGGEVDFIVMPGCYHNLRTERDLPWSDVPWAEMGQKALAFFQKHLMRPESATVERE
jgi:acetyl esterase/lipase